MLNFNLLGRTMIAVVLGAASLMACTSQKMVETPSTPSADPIRKVEPAPPEVRPIGGDRDADGCLRPAGYSWCAKENSCVRSGELAAKKSLENTWAAFEAYCSGNSK